MTRVCNDPTRFADEAIDGFVAAHPHTAHPRTARRVQGGVVRPGGPVSGQGNQMTAVARAAERGGEVLLAYAQQLQEVAR